MKPLIVLLIFTVFVSFLVHGVYAQSKEEKNSDVEIFMQIVLRNSNGNLIGYAEGTPQIFYPQEVLEWVEQRAEKSTNVKDSKKTTMLQFNDYVSWTKSESMGAYFVKLPVNDDIVTVLYFHFDSFHVVEGDTAQIFWTVLMPA
jgi:hypothetical protein